MVRIHSADFLRDWRKIAGRIDDNIKLAWDKTADDAVQSMVRYGYKDVSGDLSESMYAESFHTWYSYASDIGNSANYAKFVDEGTRPHTIARRTKRTLRWYAGGEPVFATIVHHPGTTGAKFLAHGADTFESNIERNVVDGINKVVE